jgi:Mn2+/Fe2+ NRAMP family transporter
VALSVQSQLGEAGLIIVLIGMLFAIGGATAETSLSGAYNVAQFFGWEWGKYKKPRGAPRFTLTWMIMLVLGTLIIITGLDAVQVTEFAVIFSVVALPFSYLPVLLVANDRTYMDDQVNGPFANILGWFYLVIIVIAALAAIPLMIITNMGQG